MLSEKSFLRAGSPFPRMVKSEPQDRPWLQGMLGEQLSSSPPAMTGRVLGTRPR